MVFILQLGSSAALLSGIRVLLMHDSDQFPQGTNATFPPSGFGVDITGNKNMLSTAGK